MEVRSRLALWGIALFLCVSLHIKGRLPPETGGEAAFSRPAPGTVTVRLAGDFHRQGIYHFPAGTSVATAIKMTVPEKAAAVAVPDEVQRPLASGDVVSLELDGGESPVISITKMGVRERMLLGVPLHPDRMSAEEWALLPGIGPVLSERIVTERHNNGDFGSPEGLLRVRGIGPAKLEAIRRYF